MKALFSIVMMIWVLASHGCAWMERLDEDRDAEFARADHRSCRERGYTWPSDAYLDCRRLRADERRREQWMELQMARQQQRPEVGIRPESAIEAYRPIDDDAFHCFEAVDRKGDRYLACGER